MNRAEALKYVGYCLDDSLAIREEKDMPDNARLIGWQCGFEPMFVAVWSYLDVKLDDEEAVDIAKDLLAEIEWFSDGETEPDYVL